VKSINLRSPYWRLALEAGLAAAVLLALVPWLLKELAGDAWEQRVWWELGLYLLPLQLLLLWRGHRMTGQLLGTRSTLAWRAQLGALAVLLIGLGAASVAVLRLNEQTHVLARERFNNQAETLRSAIRERLEHPLSALRGLKALYLANNDFHRLEFIRWVGSHDLSHDYPSVLGLGYIERVRRDRLDAFVARERADDAPDFEVRTTGEASDLYVIKYIEPLTPNRQAWGFDIGAERVRRTAVEAAMRSGRPTRTGAVQLVQRDQQGLGFLLLLPVHDAEALLDTEARRVEATVGFVYTPVLIEQMLESVDDNVVGQIDFELFDTDLQERPELMFARTTTGADEASRRHAVELPIFFADRLFRLRVHATQAFADAVNLHRPFWLGLFGAAVSNSLALVVWLAASGRLRANELARRITAELESKTQRFDLALDGGNDGLWDWLDTHSHAMWWSPQFYRLLGWEPGEINPSIDVFDSLLHPDDQQATQRALADALGDDQPYDVEFRLRCKNGAYRWFRSRAKVFRNAAGEHQRMAGALQDIHELKAVQADVRARNKQMAAIFAASPDAFVSIDEAGAVLYVSSAFQNLTGLNDAQVLRLSLPALLMLLASQGTGPTPLDAADLQRGPRTLELRGHRVLELSLHAAPADAGISQLLHLRDITRQAEVEQMKSEFLSTAAHELRTPMASIYGFTELMMTREMPPERRKGYLAKVYRQCQAMMAILNELLDLARIEARRGKDFDLAPHDLAALAREAAQEFAPPAGRDAPELDLGGQPAWVNVDQAKLLQTLRNLLSNAYKYSPQGGRVGISLGVGPDGDTWRLTVSDQGLGMTPEQLARVCERFYRADDSGAIPGTGLGMSIVREIIELHGGRLELTSQLGQGTQASIVLPALREEAGSPEG